MTWDVGYQLIVLFLLFCIGSELASHTKELRRIADALEKKNNDK